MRMGHHVRLVFLVLVGLGACGPSTRANGDDTPDAPQSGVDSPPGGTGFLVYAHSDHILYSIDLADSTLVTVGNFNAPQVMVGTMLKEDVITDLAVAPDGTIYTISETALYTANSSDGHVTRVGSLATCGTKAVALTTTPDGRLWTGDFKGALCQIDISQQPPVVKAPVMMGSGMGLSGDMVGVDDGTVYGTAYKLTDPSNMGTQMNNVLVKVDVATGAVTQVGASGFPKLFGAAFQEGKVFAFTHDGTGRVVTIDTATGVGTLFGTFDDPTTHMGISFAGAGVNSLILQ